MGARPPGGGGSAEPEAIEFGIAALDARLEESDLTFPATSREVLRALDHPEIPYDSKGRTIELATALDEVSRSEFENETELLDALYPVFDEARRGGRGFLGGIRDALPF
ncbi:hypothetical protein SAMN04488066_10150 [Halorubrum aquaticum]|uniref:DUF2795 domain-containing protein n=1 Tax=Halorubrum aquaticum TaxID=387340 RepID=A0A1I2YYW6_9EURY|nr:hypothetical protein [Halorubrum aquaticum]SFH30640.1 hypothetical protein SAMN04488066_10150 [Halorubrum aquaticum]